MTTRCKHFMYALGLSFAAMVVPGCDRAPARLDMPEYEATAGQGALTAYDINKDGKISGNELASSAALKSTMARIDSNRDGAITADEIDARIQQWRASRVAIMPVCCKVLLDGKPVPNAHVTLEPEPFLGNSLSAADGISDADGVAILSIPGERLANSRLTGVALGLYRIVAKVEKDGVVNTYTTGPGTGCEVAPDAPWTGEGIVVAEFSKR